jgi:hypothetical protein
MDMYPGLGGTDCFDVVRYMESDVPSTRCALLDGSSGRGGRSCAEGVETVEVASSSLSVFFCDQRPGMGKENFPRLRPMVEDIDGFDCEDRWLMPAGATTQSRSKRKARCARCGQAIGVARWTAWTALGHSCVGESRWVLPLPGRGQYMCDVRAELGVVVDGLSQIVHAGDDNESRGSRFAGRSLRYRIITRAGFPFLQRSRPRR